MVAAAWETRISLLTARCETDKLPADCPVTRISYGRSPALFLTPFLRELGGRTASYRCWSRRVGKAARLVGPVFERRSIAVRPGRAVRSETPGRTLGGTVREHDQP